MVTIRNLAWWGQVGTIVGTRCDGDVTGVRFTGLGTVWVPTTLVVVL